MTNADIIAYGAFAIGLVVLLKDADREIIGAMFVVPILVWLLHL